MDTLRDPTPDLDGFQLPAFNAPREEWETAFAKMRAIDLTWPQIEAGYLESMSGNQGFPDILLLRAWCAEQGLTLPDVAAEAILVRMSAVVEADFECPDLSEADREAMALRDLRVERDVIQFVGGAPWPEPKSARS